MSGGPPEQGDAAAREPERAQGSAPVPGAPDDREFHLDRVCERLPRALSARRLALLAELFGDDDTK
jgi:hypothetical protein